ncbi:transporter ZIP family protein [Synechococcus sp. CC9311]|uniref:transporter ZIP family protein n=1 Tax=Synechococcus sp. (strain CC9311) TaxID=64471 RepID=UPI0000DDB269|nr:transporter ZIP family protein [Synechococcus sp. CC9311]ABI45308.1 transporter, ZIP family protein [Synechococcus sp. CC9311]
MPSIALKAGLVGIVVLVSLATGRPALRTKPSDLHKAALGFGEAFAAGIFLGAGLIHMLGDAQSAFDAANVNYPFAMVTCGAVMLLLLWIEHLANQRSENPAGNKKLVAFSAVLMLSIHSLLMGAAFGISTSVTLTIVIFIAVLAH